MQLIQEAYGNAHTLLCLAGGALVLMALRGLVQFDVRIGGRRYRSFRVSSPEEREARGRGCNCGEGKRVKEGNER